MEEPSYRLGDELYGGLVTGTMAHSYVQAHGDEMEAFCAFAGLYPETVLPVDTYDTLEGVREEEVVGRVGRRARSNP